MCPQQSCNFPFSVYPHHQTEMNILLTDKSGAAGAVQSSQQHPLPNSNLRSLPAQEPSLPTPHNFQTAAHEPGHNKLSN